MRFMVPMKKRATLVISGDVQDVGFRGAVMRIAQKADLVGYVENLPDGTVRAICEGEEKAIKGFVKKLDIHGDDIDVEKIDVKWSKAQGKFKYFSVKVTNLANEMFQGFATAGRKLGTMHTDLKDGFSDLKSETRTTHEKLGSIDNRLGDALSRYDKIGKKMDNVETNLAELTKQITRLVDHMVDDKK